jgi:putative DNA primase/helicase
VDGEMQNELTKERLRELGMLNNTKLYILHHELAFNYENGLTLNAANPVLQDALIRLIEARQARLLILDNLSCLLGSLVENRSEEWEPISQWLLHLRRRGVAVIILHHTSRMGNMRGTYKREDSATWVMKLMAITDPGEINAAAHFKSTFTKFRRGAAREAVALDWHYIRQPGQLTELRVMGISLVDELVSLVKQGFDSCRGIAEILEVSPSSVVRLAKEASAAGSIRIVKGKYLPPS